MTALYYNVINSTVVYIVHVAYSTVQIKFLNAKKLTVSHMYIDETFCFVPRLQKLPKVSPEQMSVQLIQLLEEATCNDDIHDVEIIVSYC